MAFEALRSVGLCSQLGKIGVATNRIEAFYILAGLKQVCLDLTWDLN